MERDAHTDVDDEPELATDPGPWSLPDLTGLSDDDLIEGPDGPVSVGYARRVWADSFTGGTVYKGGMSDTGPEAMAALLRGGVLEWRRFCQENGLHPRPEQ